MRALRQFFNTHILSALLLIFIFAAALVLAPAGRFVFAQEAPLEPPPTTETVTTENTDPPPSSNETTPTSSLDAGTDETANAESPDTDAGLLSIPMQFEEATSTDGSGGLATTTGGTIITDDANASTTVDNLLNLNTVNGDIAGQEMNSSTFTASSTNSGILDSAATSTAMTGENEVIGGEGVNLIVTGNAVSTANVINEVNTNIFNSDGLIVFLNHLFGDGIDLSGYDLSYFFAGGPGASPTVNDAGEAQCTLFTCLNSSTLNVWNTNDATVTNSVIVRSATGENIASSTADATVQTGDAYAAANVVNLVNTNIINSSYLLVAYNNFGDLEENITLPHAAFFDALFETGAASTSINSSTYEVSAVNDVNLTGTTTAAANTGTNIASSTLESIDPLSTSTPEATGAGVITTGDAYASSHTYNQANTNNVGGTSVFMLFRVSGDWNGRILGLPSGLTPSFASDGNDTLIQIVSDNGTTTPTAAKLLEEYNASHFSAISTSSADVENNIDVSADTGHNTALTQNGTSTVNTGNAYASANVVNLVNTNIVGQNWIFAVFNIFGDLNGDIVFGGSPILIVGASPSRTEVHPGDEVSYTFTVQNTGKSDASDVIVNASFDNSLLTFSSGDLEMTPTETGASWNVGRVRHGESETFTVTARVGTNFPAGQTASMRFTAAAVNDNITAPATSETVNAPITISSPSITESGGGGGGGGGGSTSSAKTSAENPDVSMTKKANIATTTAPSNVDYKVVIFNKKYAGPVFGTKLTDTLYDPNGKVVYTRSWDLATLAPGDEINLSYTVNYASTTATGVYRNVAQVTGKRNSANGKAIKPVETSSTVYVIGNGSVLGAATSTITMTMATSTLNAPTTCTPLLTQNMRPGLGNNAVEVQKLQTFLNTHIGANLPVTGYFGPMTTQAVRQFQARYAAEILAPVGLSVPSGFVFTMTLGKINALGCGGTAPTAFVVPPMPQAAAAVAVAPPPAPKPKPAAPAPAKKAPVVPAPAQEEDPAPAPVTPPPPAPQNESGGLFGWFKGLF